MTGLAIRITGVMLRATALAVLLAGPAMAQDAGSGRVGPEALDRLPRADVVLLGEVHDNAAHHLMQARAIGAIKPVALVFEMLTPERAAQVPADRSDAATVEAALGWNASGWPDFAMYHPIFLAAPKARIYGGDVPRADIRVALDFGAAQAFGAEAGRYGLNADLPATERAAREEEQAVAHCRALPLNMLPGMVEAQRLRDASLAQAVVQALAETGGPVVVITGAGHARRDRGVPAVLALAAPDASVLSLGLLEEVAEVEGLFDLWIITGVPDGPGRGDPCAAFGQQKA